MTALWSSSSIFPKRMWSMQASKRLRAAVPWCLTVCVPPSPPPHTATHCDGWPVVVVGAKSHIGLPAMSHGMLTRGQPLLMSSTTEGIFAAGYMLLYNLGSWAANSVQHARHWVSCRLKLLPCWFAYIFIVVRGCVHLPLLVFRRCPLR